MCSSLLVCAKAAGRTSSTRIGRQWPVSGAPAAPALKKRRRGEQAVSGLEEKKDEGEEKSRS